MKKFTSLLVVAAACLLPATAHAAVTYTLRQGNNIDIKFDTPTPLTSALTMTDFTGQRCVVATFTAQGTSCRSLTLDPTYKNANGGAGVQLELKSATVTSYFLFGADALSINGSYTAGFLQQVTLTVSGAPAIAPVSPVPEPATWALMLAGFGLTGAAMRRRRVSVARVLA